MRIMEEIFHPSHYFPRDLALASIARSAVTLILAVLMLVLVRQSQIADCRVCMAAHDLALLAIGAEFGIVISTIRHAAN